MIVVAGKVEHGTTDHKIGKSVRKGHCLDRFQAKVVRREGRCDGCSEIARCLESARIRIRAKHFKALSEEVNEIATKAAARIKNPHPDRDAPSEKLIEQIDLDSAELNIKIAHVASIIACRSDMWVLAMYMSDNPTTQELEEFRMRTSPAHAVFTVPKRTVFGAAHDGVWLKVSLPLSRGKIFRKAPQIACPTWNDANLLLDPSVLAETI